MAADALFQRCVNAVSAAYSATAHQTAVVNRSVRVQVDSQVLVDNSKLNVRLPQKELVPSEISPVRVPFTPEFNPFRVINLSGTWSDTGRLYMQIDEGKSMVHYIPTPRQANSDVVAFSLTDYSVGQITKDSGYPGQLVFALHPERWRQSAGNLWLTRVAFSDNCMPLYVELAGYNDRKMQIYYADGGGASGAPEIQYIHFEEILPVSRQHLYLDVQFEP